MVSIREEVDAEAKEVLLRCVYKFIIINSLRICSVKFRFSKKIIRGEHGNCFLSKLLLTKRETSNKEDRVEITPVQKKMVFRGKTNKRLKALEDRKVLKMILSSLVWFLDDKFVE